MILSVLLPLQVSQPSESEWKSLFGDYKGTVIIREISSGKEVLYNPKSVDTGYPPCSTFKVPNSLFGLEKGVLTGKNTLYKWDRKKHSRPEANKDQTLESAFQQSIVWYYQIVARKIGEASMKSYLKATSYGNQDISGGIDNFWLMSSMTISPRNQVDFVEKLDQETLPFSKKNQRIVKELMTYDQGSDWAFRGKTGTGDAVKSWKRQGWFVGLCHSNRNRYAFAFFATGEDVNGPKVREIARKALINMKILPPHTPSAR